MLKIKGRFRETISLAQDNSAESCWILHVLVANKTIEEHKGSNEDGLVFKVDFLKDYDHLSRRSLDYLMHRKGFGERWKK